MSFAFENHSCADCHSSCSSCNGSSESQCILCKPNRFSLEGKCLTSCPDGFYGDKKRKECLPCPTGCATCSSDTCLTCKADWVKNKKDKCVTKGSNNCDECKQFQYDYRTVWNIHGASENLNVRLAAKLSSYLLVGQLMATANINRTSEIQPTNIDLKYFPSFVSLARNVPFEHDKRA